MKLRTLLMTAMAASTLLLSGCWINDTESNNGSSGAAQTTTVTAFAANNIQTGTNCANNTPQNINSINFTPDNTTQTDVSTLTPGC